MNSKTNPKTLYALDFDGVICNSAIETALTGWLAAQSLWSELEGLVLSDQQIRQFVQLRPCLEYGYEAILIVRLLYSGVSLQPDCSDYNYKIQEFIDESAFDIEDLKILFGRTRDIQIQNDETAWLTSNPLFEGVREKLLSLEQQDWVVVTTKQERFVAAILKANGIDLDASRIFGLDRQLGKQQVLQNLLQQEPEREIIFIEDRLPTLSGVQQNSALGAMSLKLVDWGYNTQAERDLARKQGIEVISIENFLD